MSDSDSSLNNSSEYEVEAIEKDRRRKDHYDEKTKKWIYINEYLIKWVGYKRRSWEPEENLNNCIELLNKYKKNKYKNNNNIINDDNKNNNNKTPLKFMASKIRHNNNKREEKRENSHGNIINNNIINNNISYYKYNNNNPFNKSNSTNNFNMNPYYSDDEEEDKFSPININSYFVPNLLKSENGSLTSGESLIKKKEKKNSSDYDIDIENFLVKEQNINIIDKNNENKNDNFIEIINDYKEKVKEEENEENNNNNILQNNIFLNNKRKLNNKAIISDKDSSSISISIDDPFIKMESISLNNTNENTNSNNSNHYMENNKDNDNNIEILEVRISDDKEEQINLVCRNKEKDFVFQTNSKNMVIPQKTIIKCYEKILKNYLLGKTIKIK